MKDSSKGCAEKPSNKHYAWQADESQVKTIHETLQILDKKKK